MRKQKPLTVVGYAALQPGRLYPVRVMRVRANLKSRVLWVTVEHVHKEQEGRIQELVLPLPVRPTGVSASFFNACAMRVHEGAEIDPREAVGTLISARFENTTDGRDPRAIAFDPLRTETPHGERTE